MELQLEQVEEHAVDQRVKEWIRQAITHMRKGRNRRGGAELIALLAEARQRAADYDEWHVVRLLQDSIDYAGGRILRPVMEEQYCLFQDGLRNENKRELIAGVLSAALRFAAEASKKYMAEHPDTALPELLEYVESLGQDAEFLEAPEDRPGRYRIPRGQTEQVIWIERVLRNRIDIEDIREEARRLAMSPKDLEALAADAGCIFLRVPYFRVFRSCGEVEALDSVLVVAAEVVLVAVALPVVVHVVVEVAVDDDGAELEDDLSAVGRPPGPCNSEPVFDDEPAGALDHPGGDRASRCSSALS